MISKLVRFAVRTFFREVLIEGSDHLPSGGPAIFAPNHPNGLLDPMLLFFISHSFRLRFVAKAPLFRIPLFGALLRSMGAIPVVRKFEASGEVDYNAFFSSCVDALAAGDCVVIFPEGRSLPQSYLAPLKTGPARLFLQARSRNIISKIIPVGLNYEKGTTFRSRVLICVAPPVDTSAAERIENTSAAVRQLTTDLSDSLEKHVVQAETYRERELMILLERITLSQKREYTELERFSRLKGLEDGLVKLREKASGEIEALRNLLSRYERLCETYSIDGHARPASKSFVLPAIAGAALAIPGWIFNLLPYQLIALLIKVTRRDASDIATFKVIYSLFLFPLTYVAEALLISRFTAPVFAWLFALLIIPLSYFTLYFLEWYDRHFAGSLWFGYQKRVVHQLDRLRKRILAQMEKLASHPELQQ